MSRPLRVALRTQGCKVNLFDQWEIEDGLRKLARPVDVVPWSDPADVYVVNTCTVTAKADRQNRQIVYQLGRREPGAGIVVTGCQAQVDPESVAALPGVVRVVPNTDKARLPDIIAELGRREDLDGQPPALVARRTRPFLKIQDGCNTGCTYCILPRARGTSRSMSADEVLARLHALGEAGAPEVVVTGLNMGDWGRDLRPRTSLAALLLRIDDEAPVPRIRLSSIEPRGITEELVHVLAGSRGVCHHLHVPLQAGDDEVLKRMHRPYRRRWFLALCERLRAAMPDLSLGTDIICGFPGETAAASERSADIAERVGFSYIHAFPYSRRAGTAAAAARDDVSPQHKKARVKRLRALSEAGQAAFAAAHVGRTVEVAVERRTEAGLARGLSRTYVPVWFEAGATSPEMLAHVTVQRTDGARAFGNLA